MDGIAKGTEAEEDTGGCNTTCDGADFGVSEGVGAPKFNAVASDGVDAPDTN